MTRLYIGGLSPQTTVEMIQAFLEGDGRKVTHVNVKKKVATGKPRGFAFVDMASQSDVESAVTNLDGGTLDGRKVKVGVAKIRVERGGQFSDDGYGSYGGGRGGFKGRRR